jgi:hypothetical protein
MRTPQNWKKKSPTCFDKTAILYSIVSKQVGAFFQIFVAFSEKLNFNFDFYNNF